ncbi:MAG: hypothetical protein AVDCRST_MAG05-2841, partial [uncultured Rubrobacteraceae bacterium]
GYVHLQREEEHRGRVLRRARHVLAQAVVGQVLYPAAGDAQLQAVLPGALVDTLEPARLGLLSRAHLLRRVRHQGQDGSRYRRGRPQLRAVPVLRPLAVPGVLGGDEQGYERRKEQRRAGAEGRFPDGDPALHQHHRVDDRQVLRRGGAPYSGRALRQGPALDGAGAAAHRGAAGAVHPRAVLLYGGCRNLPAGPRRGDAARHSGHVLPDAHHLVARQASRGDPVGRRLQPARLPGKRLQGGRALRQPAGNALYRVLHALLRGALRRRVRAVQQAQGGVRGQAM